MGCRISSSNNDNFPTTNTEMPNSTVEQPTTMDYKARLERKQCLAKETPEPIYDLADCNLKDVPPGVYVMCKVLRKELLTLANNKLTSLGGGGTLDDLQLLVTLNLISNRFKKLPDEIYKLENLRELLVSNNYLEKLPPSINRLKKLELLDVSTNNLTTLEQITFLPNLRILNISGNVRLTKLSNQLATCDNLVDLVLDPNSIVEPPADIVNRGTNAIIKYLSTGEIVIPPPEDQLTRSKTSTINLISSERDIQRQSDLERDRYMKERKLLESERLAYEKDYLAESKLHEKQQKKKQELLQQLLQQQNQNESYVTKLQEEKQSERQRLINDILKDEEHSSELVQKLLSLKNGPDPAFLECERKDQERLIEQLRIQQNDLRKQEILTAMTDLLENEINVVQNFHNQRDQSSRNILEREYETNNLLNNVFLNYDRNRHDIIEQINCDEEIQKSAVAALIARNDSRTWGLVEQVRIVESQLAALTTYEIDRKKTSQDDQINNLAEQRLNLTYVLMDLLKQQDQRKQQLLETLKVIEQQQESEQTDFWLMQYQKLLDHQPSEITKDTASVDPILGYQFLENGAVHCLPFLSKIWQNRDKELSSINEHDLIDASVQNSSDRQAILLSISNYYDYLNQRIEYPETEAGSSTQSPTAPPLVEDREHQVPSSPPEEHSVANGAVQFAECVVCLEETVQVIFLPCGHMCCCAGCQIDIHDCPLCRAYIERKIKVIQP
ncbi:E3 ubiquitin-protein ligase LRSAM1-like [Topomyia yanbarensis]|uniref:E3 ubiquitin-protein ligase LRSAM1-like n=1 Tax=Topomyia yanbarensis TaxID=2498891 RepID=UPI00273AF101|nr:E3 ubiquitin-protein ligase LRSAM1-like [Topomyia yanbarensis]XP_058830180.1 E3 ubiquitin-protein ligase LRSAM1-like [Topomyia yanbarensis]XP_058830181.1 E3 ubiquitin-protein ligase LRSAM1-like [Topomyia yanbarensis]XP_058830182.1 E3 ubiquitin-protein ligase LRSAM1-like [Topomyia yanbarensis]XP_058830183.1 E3 ubiquitin-protein ligase LRSAM1-like [Topomyia yanbarensis]XP_058830184.1 E3 ubiquitin-protein ligase LRSAM1-like [Topomyia yanbarensis]